MSIIIKSGDSGDLASVDAHGNLQVNPPLNDVESGFVALATETDAGSVTGTRVMFPLEATDDYQLRVGVDQLWDTEVFNGTAINTAKFLQNTTTATIAVVGGYLALNSGNSTTTGHQCRVQTYRYFPMYSANSTYTLMDFAYFSTGLQPNVVVELGFGLATGTADPTEGAFFRYNSAGQLRCVVAVNSTEQNVLVATPPPVNTTATYLVSVEQDRVSFWIDNVLVGVINAGPAAGGGGIFLPESLPLLFRWYNLGVPVAAVQARLSKYAVTLGGFANAREWAIRTVGAGQGAYQGQTGGTMGSTANMVNSAAPATGTPTNVVAGYATFGGQWQIAAPAGAETDLILFAYLNPAGTAAISGKTLYITGINIATYNTGAAGSGATPTVLQWALGVGSTAVTLATAEGAGTKATRRTPLGVQVFPVSAAIGAVAEPIVLMFPSPQAVDPGQYVHVLLKVPIGAATASQVLRGVVGINGYYE